MSRDVAYYERFAREYSHSFTDFEENMEEVGERLDGVLRECGAAGIRDASCGFGRQAIPLKATGTERAMRRP